MRGRSVRLGAWACRPPGCAGVPSAWGRGRSVRLGARAFRPPGCAGVPSAWVRGRPVRLGARASRPPGGAGVPSAWGRGRSARLGARVFCPPGCAGVLPAWVRGRSARLGARASRPPECAGVSPAWVRGHLACLGARASCPREVSAGRGRCACVSLDEARASLPACALEAHPRWHARRRRAYPGQTLRASRLRELGGARASRPPECAGVSPAWVRGHLACLGARASRPPPKETGVALFDAPEGRGSARRRFSA